MRFLNENDYKKQIRQWVKNLVTYEDENVLTDAELAAQAEMETYLLGRYATTAIFDTDQPAGQRNPLIVMYLVDMALYHLHSNITPADVPDVRETRYKTAIAWLKDVAAGRISPNLPVLTATEGETLTLSLKLGSHTKETERY